MMEYNLGGGHENMLRVTPLGAGSEVGRSCIVLEYKGKRIMLDCGIHPAYTGRAALPYFDFVDLEDIDLALITHFHLDHCGALPFLTEKTGFKGEVYMTHPTKAIYRALLSDYLKKNTQDPEEKLYQEVDINNSFEKIKLVDYHQELEYKGIKFVAYNAGHVIGAAMFLVEIEGVKILYTGDYSREEDRHLNPAEFPQCDVQILIVESTYGTQPHEPRKNRETRFTKAVSEVVERGGRCLLPVFALGRAQELLLILEEYWATHSHLHKIPIYYASSLVSKCMTVFESYFNLMAAPFKRQLELGHNPFTQLKYITTLKKQKDFLDSEPAVVIASPGMLQKGFSRDLFEKWCSDEKNGVVFTGYAVEGTLAQKVIHGGKEFTSASNGTKPMIMKMSYDYISFSAHCDYTQTVDFVKHLTPNQIVLVHGDPGKMGELRKELSKQFTTAVNVLMPKNCESIKFSFKTHLKAKAVGALAEELGKYLTERAYSLIRDPMVDISRSNSEDSKDEMDYPYEGRNYVKVSGIITKKGSDIRVMAQKDVPKYTYLQPCTIKQKLYIPYHGSMEIVKAYLQTLFAKIKFTPDNLIEDSVHLWKDEEKQAVAVEWVSSPKVDRVVDSLGFLIMELEEQQYKDYIMNDETVASKMLTNGDEKYRVIKEIVSNRYENVLCDDNTRVITVTSPDEQNAQIDCKSLLVESGSEILKDTLTSIVRQVENSMSPMLIP